MNGGDLASALKDEARRIGFELAGIAPAVSPAGFTLLRDWLARGFAGQMEYIPRREDAYEHPEHVLPAVRSVIMLAVNYQTAEPQPAHVNEGRIARYAWGAADYHDLLRDKLRLLADFLHAHRPGCRTRGVVDTAPLLERDFARLAGLGWFGKNTMLINKHSGSWLFLAALLTDVELPPDAPHDTSHCGTCTRCLDVCPTNAFPEPYVLDARKCISYLTIELRDEPIPVELREPMGEWLFGCDLCQEVCPWNRKAPEAAEAAFQPAPDLNPADAVALLRLSEDEFRDRFRHTPLERPRRSGLLRNAAIVVGNCGDNSAIPALIRALNDSAPLVRSAAAWALGKFSDVAAREAIMRRIEVEDDPAVTEECYAALHSISAGNDAR